MSRKSFGNDEGDHVECIHCTCMPPKVEQKGELLTGQLNNWEKWINERKQIHDKLSKSLDRPAGDLLMNVSDQCRQLQEERLVFEYCRVNTHFDKYRGNPAFWKLPIGLVDKRDRSIDPIYFTKQTKIELNEIAPIEYVATPNYVLKEKGLIPRTRTLYAQKCKKTKMISSKMKEIEHHIPDCEDLMIIGEKVLPPKKSTEIIHSQEKQDFEDTPKQSPAFSDTEAGPETCFIINGIVLSKYACTNDIIKIRLTFESTTDMRIPLVKYIKFKNEGATTLRINWNRVEKYLLFRDLIRCYREESYSFFFNKNELILPPDDTTYFPIWFKSKNIGNYYEIWEITTKPVIWNDDFKVIVTLQGFVYPAGFEEKSTDINNMLCQREANTIIRGVLNDILQQLKYKETSNETFKFSEEQLFESANQEMWGIEKRPKYLYNKHAIAQLKLLYDDVKLSESPKMWNYSVTDLKMLARMKDIWVYVENQTKEMLKARQRREELTAIIKGHGDNPHVVERESSLEEIAEVYCRRLDNILQGLEKPSMVVNKERLKYVSAFTAVRTCLYKMCDAIDKYEDSTFVSSEFYYPGYNYKNVTSIEMLPERLIFERFNDIWIKRTKKSPPETKCLAHPKPEILKDIPIENSKLIYRTYFNITDEDPKKVDLTKKKPFDVSSNKLEPEKNKKLRESTMQLSTVKIKEGFDPFAEEYTPNTSKVSEVSSSSHTKHVQIKAFNYHKYLIVYTHLAEAVDAVVNALETLTEVTVDVGVLGDLIKCTDVKLKSAASEEKIKTTKSDTPTENANVLEDEPYFLNLLDSHLNKNQHTKEYIIEGKRKQSREETSQPTAPDTPDSQSLDSWLFKSDENIVEEIKSSASVAIQTSEVNVGFKISDMLLKSESYHSLRSNVQGSRSHDIFYFIPEEEESNEQN